MSLIGTNNEEKIWNYLKAAGLNDYGTAGLMGNIFAESGLIPTNLQNTFEKKLGMTDAEYTKGVDNGTYDNFVKDSAGYGLAQWTWWTRKQALLDYAKASGKSIGDLEMQLEFLIKELAGYPGLTELLKSAKDVNEASDAVLLQFERPADQSAAVRAKWASYGQSYYNKYAGQTVSQKEVLTLKLVESILTKNPCYTSGRKIIVKGLMLHSVGCSQPNANVFIKLWNSPNYSNACVHGFIDANDGVAYQTLPWDHRGWHCGAAANNTHIGVEMCEPGCIKYIGGATFTCTDTNKPIAQAAVKRTYETAVQLFAMLCKRFGLDPLDDGVVISHKEGCARGIASNHGDPEHLWTQLGMSYTMNGFRKDVKAAMSGSTVIASEAPEASTSLPYQVRIEVKNLNIRSAPDKSSSSNGFAAPGVYTIVAESDGDGATKWGKLKSGAGWVSLDYCKKITSSAPAQIVSELDQAINKLAELGVINSPDYWRKAAASVKYLDALIIKSAAKITGSGVRLTSAEAGIDRLVKDGIINSPDYWRLHYADYANIDALLCALGGAKKG